MTETTTTYNLEPFPGSKSHRLAWPSARRMYISRAMTAHNNGTDRTGLLYFLVDHAEFSDLAFKMLDVTEEGVKNFFPWWVFS